MTEQFAFLLQRAAPIGLQELNESSLLNRVDTKFLLNQRQLLQALQNVLHQYRVLTVHGTQLQKYRTLYFDTPDFTHYLAHHNGKRSRYKVRCRRYEDSDLAFLEIKQKTNKNRTIKERMPIEEIGEAIAPTWTEFLHNHYPGRVSDLEPKVWNRFTRITLVGIERVERLTLDIGVQFLWKDEIIQLPDFVIAEVKQAKWSLHSAFVQQLQKLHVQPGGVSKYCLGAMRFYPWLKQNRFKEKSLQINRLINHE